MVRVGRLPLHFYFHGCQFSEITLKLENLNVSFRIGLLESEEQFFVIADVTELAGAGHNHRATTHEGKSQVELPRRKIVRRAHVHKVRHRSPQILVCPYHFICLPILLKCELNKLVDAIQR